MGNWYMVTLVGADRPGIVARVSGALFEAGCNLGEASMMRLGGNFTVMLMAGNVADESVLERVLRPVADALALRLHIDRIEGRLHQHVEPDVRVTVFGADRPGIVARVTGALAAAGLNILELESDVGGTESKPIYVMQIEGVATRGRDALQAALAGVQAEGIDVRVEPIDILIG